MHIEKNDNGHVIVSYDIGRGWGHEIDYSIDGKLGPFTRYKIITQIYSYDGMTQNITTTTKYHAPREVKKLLKK